MADDAREDPGGHTVRVADTDLAFRVEAGERVLAAARRAGVWLPFECGWGSCGTCKVALLDGEVELLYPEAPTLDERDARRGRTITCQTTATSDLTIKVRRLGPAEERPTADYDAVLAEVVPLGPDISAFRFTLDRPADFRPGQYAILEPAPGLRRCYSMAGLPGSPEVEFVAKRYPGKPGSNALFDLAVGAACPMELPYGDMWLRPGDDPVVLVAGGTGISPVLSLVRQLAAAGHGGEVDVVFGANSRAELVLWEELVSLVEALPRGRLHGVIASPGDDWTGLAGLAPDHLPTLLTGAERCYLAGPPGMVDATLQALRACDVSLALTHYDRFG